MKTIKVGFVGTGYIAHFHARALKEIDNVELGFTVNPNIESAKNFSSLYRIPHYCGDYNVLLQNPDIELVVLSVPNVYHYQYTKKALERGKHVFVEKPMSFTVKEAEDMKKRAQKNKCALMVGHMWRFDREVRYLKKEIKKNKLGKIFKTTGYGIHVNWGPGGWFAQKEKAGGGALVDMGIHAIDTVRYLLGDPKPVKVYAKIGTFIKDIQVDDTGLLMIDWDNGVTSIIESGWWQPHMDGPEAGTKIYGSDGFASLFPTYLKKYRNNETVQQNPKFPERIGHCDQHMYTLQMEELIKAIRENREPSPGADIGIVNMKIITSAYTSSEKGEVVYIK